VASNITNREPCHLHENTTYPIKNDDEIFIETAQEVQMLMIRFAALRKEEEMKAQIQTPPTKA
jgi:hypothetical protein